MDWVFEGQIGGPSQLVTFDYNSKKVMDVSLARDSRHTTNSKVEIFEKGFLGKPFDRCAFHLPRGSHVRKRAELSESDSSHRRTWRQAHTSIPSHTIALIARLYRSQLYLLMIPVTSPLQI